MSDSTVQGSAAGRESIRRASADMRAMKRIAKDWNTLTDAGKKFMLSALMAGRKDLEDA